MAISITRALALTTALGAATIIGAHAIAQTASPPSPTPAPSQSAPGAEAPGAGAGRGMGPGMGQGMGQGMGPGMGQGMGSGMREGMGARMGRGGDGYSEDRGYRGRGEGQGRGRMSQWSEQDRQAMLAARLAAVKAGLLLTPEQEKLWPPLENAIREAMKQRQDWRERLRKEGPASNPVERMRRMGEMASARGAALTRIAEAAAPLYDALSDDQKRRLRLIHRMGRGGMMGMMGMMESGRRMRGHGGHGHHYGMHGGDYGKRGHGHDMRGGRHHDDHRGGYRRGYSDDEGSELRL